MHLVLRDANDADQEFAFRVKEAALGAYVRRVWGWDEEFQRRLHANNWAEHRPAIVLHGDEAIGTLDVVAHPDHLYVGEFYLLPAWQRQGLGTRLLEAVIARAEREHLAIRLQFLKINPVRSLYERHGFQITRETDTHYLAERSQGSAEGTP